MPRTARLFVIAGLLAVGGCLTYEDRCLNVSCPDKEVCIDLQDGPRCVCDAFHVDEDGSCVDPAADEEDAGPEAG